MRKFFRKTAIFLVAVQIAMLSLPAYNYAAESSHDTGIEASNESLEDRKSKKEADKARGVVIRLEEN